MAVKEVVKTEDGHELIIHLYNFIFDKKEFNFRGKQYKILASSTKNDIITTVVQEIAA